MSTIMNPCAESETTAAYALHALDASEAAAAEKHIASCADCQRELQELRATADAFVAWPTDVLRPATALKDRLASRIGNEGVARAKSESASTPSSTYVEPEWEKVAPGIECKLLATDHERKRVSMLVRLEPGARYPAHTHAGVEELHLLAGELWIDGNKLLPGDYNYGPAGAGDESVWSETGCTCILITSTEDILR